MSGLDRGVPGLMMVCIMHYNNKDYYVPARAAPAGPPRLGVPPGGNPRCRPTLRQSLRPLLNRRHHQRPLQPAQGLRGPILHRPVQPLQADRVRLALRADPYIDHADCVLLEGAPVRQGQEHLSKGG